MAPGPKQSGTPSPRSPQRCPKGQPAIQTDDRAGWGARRGRRRAAVGAGAPYTSKTARVPSKTMRDGQPRIDSRRPGGEVTPPGRAPWTYSKEQPGSAQVEALSWLQAKGVPVQVVLPGVQLQSNCSAQVVWSGM